MNTYTNCGAVGDYERREEKAISSGMRLPKALAKLNGRLLDLRSVCYSVLAATLGCRNN
jgi:hypothetical protein